MSHKRISTDDLIFNIINYTVLLFSVAIVIYPLYFIIIASFSNPLAVNNGEVWLLPKGITFEGYRRLFNYKAIWIGYRNTIFYTVLGTFINITLTLTCAYALSRKDFYGRNLIMGLIAFTMFFGGGLIPTYLLVRSLHINNTIWALVLPNAVGAYNIIICRTFFSTTIPPDLLESAQLDGCSTTRFFTGIVLPLSKPVISVMILFYAVGHWNNFFDALIYLSKANLLPLQLILRNILIVNDVASSMTSDATNSEAKYMITEMIKYGAIIVSSLPVIILYPFLQKYFAKGIMIGAIKG